MKHRVIRFVSACLLVVALAAVGIIATSAAGAENASASTSCPTSTSYPSCFTRQTGIYFCTNRNFTYSPFPYYCTSPFAAAKANESAHLVCYRVGPDNSKTWFYVFLPNGTEGYVLADDFNSKERGRGDCGTINWQQASDFAFTHLGQTNEPGTTTPWDDLCLTFANDAWNNISALATGTYPINSALQAWGQYKQRAVTPTALPAHGTSALGLPNYGGTISTNMAYAPPRGALVFFDNPQYDTLNLGDGAVDYGHVAISLGDWQAIGTGPKTTNFDIRSTAGTGYLGWVIPWAPPTGYPYITQGLAGNATPG